MQEILIAKKYSKAIKKICNTTELREFYRIFSELSQAFAISKFEDIMYSHEIHKTSKHKLLMSMTSTNNTKIHNLLNLLVLNGRVNIIPFLSKEIKKIIDSENNVYDAVLYIKEKTDENVLSNLSNSFSKKMNIGLNLSVHIDDEMDGIRLSVPDLGIEISFFKERFVEELCKHVLKAI